jgi:hypothetical protein
VGREGRKQQRWGSKGLGGGGEGGRHGLVLRRSVGVKLVAGGSLMIEIELEKPEAERAV